jgi:hypothetical protein
MENTNSRRYIDFIYNFSYFQAYKKEWVTLKEIAVSHWRKLSGGGAKKRPDNWTDGVLNIFKKTLQKLHKKIESSQVSTLS